VVVAAADVACSLECRRGSRSGFNREGELDQGMKEGYVSRTNIRPTSFHGSRPNRETRKTAINNA
jgi:hypothetical protein